MASLRQPPRGFGNTTCFFYASFKAVWYAAASRFGLQQAITALRFSVETATALSTHNWAVGSFGMMHTFDESSSWLGVKSDLISFTPIFIALWPKTTMSWWHLLRTLLIALFIAVAVTIRRRDARKWFRHLNMRTPVENCDNGMSFSQSSQKRNPVFFSIAFRASLFEFFIFGNSVSRTLFI